jgi:hypothetical protein
MERNQTKGFIKNKKKLGLTLKVPQTTFVETWYKKLALHVETHQGNLENKLMD